MKQRSWMKWLLIDAVVIGIIWAVIANKKSKSPAEPTKDVVEEWGEESFPASDPPAHW